MAKLNTAERKKIPSSEFGLPGSRKYPMPDKSHAEDAKRMVGKEEKAGKLSASSGAKIDAKADRVLGHGAGGAGGSKHVSGMSGQKNIVHGNHAEKMKHC